MNLDSRSESIDHTHKVHVMAGSMENGFPSRKSRTRNRERERVHTSTFSTGSAHAAAIDTNTTIICIAPLEDAMLKLEMSH
jgi:hypothetical protein